MSLLHTIPDDLDPFNDIQVLRFDLLAAPFPFVNP